MYSANRLARLVAALLSCAPASCGSAPHEAAAEQPGTFMDELLRAGVPEIKLALGDVIDRENARPLPPRYARLLPDTVLRVTLRADAAEALLPIAADLER